MIERLREVAVARLQLLEQPHVLDGDDGLVGEGLKQGDLLVRERIDLGAAELDSTDRFPFTQEGNGQRRAMTELASEGAAFRILLRLGLEISHLYGSPLEDGASPEGSTHHREAKIRGEANRTVVRDQLECAPVQLKQGGVVGSTEARGALHDRVQDGLE